MGIAITKLFCIYCTCGKIHKYWYFRELGFLLGEKGERNKESGIQRKTLGIGLELEYPYEFVI